MKIKTRVALDFAALIVLIAIAAYALYDYTAVDRADPHVMEIVKSKIGTTCQFKRGYEVAAGKAISVVAIDLNPDAPVQMSIILVSDNHGKYSVVNPFKTGDVWGTASRIFVLDYVCASRDKAITALHQTAEALGITLVITTNY